MDKIEGFLEVGRTDDSHEVVINHPDLKPDKNGVGHIIFSPRQARHLACLLLKHAEWADAEAAGKKSPYEGVSLPSDPFCRELYSQLVTIAERSQQRLAILKRLNAVYHQPVTGGGD